MAAVSTLDNDSEGPPKETSSDEGISQCSATVYLPNTHDIVLVGFALSRYSAS